jgi:hypothetical protein
MAGATSLRARYYSHLGTRSSSTDEQLDGESFKLSSGSSSPITPSPLSGARSDQVDSDGEVDMVVRKASSQHPEVVAKSVGTGSLQSLDQNNQTPIQSLVYGQGRVRSKTISRIPQSPNSFAKLAQDKLLRMESDSPLAVTEVASSSTSGPTDGIADLIVFPSITTSHQPMHHPSASEPSSSSIPEELAAGQASSTAERVQSAPVRREEPLEQGTRPNAGRSQSDATLWSSSTKSGSDKSNDVRKRIEQLEAKMRGGPK